MRVRAGRATPHTRDDRRGRRAARRGAPHRAAPSLARVPAAALAAFAALAALVVTAAPARATPRDDAPARLGLAVAGPSRVAVGEPVRLTLTVTNRGDAPCDVVTSPAATVRVTGVTRDGKPVAPVFGGVDYLVGLNVALGASVTTIQPGASVAVPLVAEREAGDVELSTVDALPGGDGLTSSWSLRERGRYDVGLVYGTPQSVGALPCSGFSGVASVSFRVGSANGALPARLARSRWAVAGGAVVVLLALVLLARRSRRRGHAALLLVLCASGLTVAHPRVARAEIYVGDLDPPAFGVAVNACLATFRGKGGDPAGIMPGVDKAGPRIRIAPKRPEDPSDSFAGNDNGQQVVRWSSRIGQGVPPLDRAQGQYPAVLQDPCSNLYHELAHARDFNDGGLDKRSCDHYVIKTDEARATLAENQFRASRKPPLPQRRTYSGATLPKTLAECDKRDASNARRRGSCAALAAAPGAPPCDPDLPPDPPSGAAMSNGDPHLVTFDGRYYDFQAVGEFVAVRSASGDLEVQTRQSAYPGSTTVAVDTAVALRVGADRLALTLEAGEISVVLNGARERWERGTRALPGGGKAARRPSPNGFEQDGYTVRWPDGSRAWVDPVGSFGLRVFVSLAPGRAKAVTGLFGNFDGDRENDLARPDGEVLRDASFEALYPAYADGWRVSESGSLFAYPLGRGTASYTDRTFPSRPVAAKDLGEEQRRRARTVCERAGVTDPAQLDACVLDVGLTGETAFAVAGGDAQGSVTPSVAVPPPVVTPGAGDRTLAVTEPGGTAELTVQGVAGQRLLVDVLTSTLPNGCGVVQLRAPDGTLVTAACVINGTGLVDAVTLPATGTYTVRLDPAEDATGTATLRFVRPVDETRAVAVDGPSVTATVDVPGAVSRLTFDGRPGLKVFADVLTSTIADACGVLTLLDPSGARVAGGCVLGGTGMVDGTTVEATGRYTLLVDPPERLTGTATVRVTSAHDQQGRIAVGGEAVTAVIGDAGAVARLTFDGVAGRGVVVDAEGSTLPDACGLLVLLDPRGAPIARGCVLGGTGRIDATPLPATGRYVLLVDPDARATGRVTLRLHT